MSKHKDAPVEDGKDPDELTLTPAQKGGRARKAALSDEEKSAIARKGGLAKRLKGLPSAIRKGNFKEHFGADMDCYVLDDAQHTAVISQRGMGVAIGMTDGGGRLPRFMSSKNMASHVGPELAEKIANPLKFKWTPVGSNVPLPTLVHGYDVTFLIDLCKAIIAADEAGNLGARYQKMVKQASVILHASAKAGIKGLVYALTGYDATREETIAAFKTFVAEEAREYEKEFPDQLYAEWYRLYRLTRPGRNKPWKFKTLTIDHVYMPLAKSNGKILALTRQQKAKGDDRRAKLHQFLTDVGVKALRTHLGRLCGIAEMSPTQRAYEANVDRIFGRQLDLPGV